MLGKEITDSETAGARSIATKLGWAADYDILIGSTYYSLEAVAEAFLALKWMVYKNFGTYAGYDYDTSVVPFDWIKRDNEINYVLKATKFYPMEDVMDFKARGITIEQIIDAAKNDIDAEMVRTTFLS